MPDIALFIPLMALSIPLVAVWTHHLRKIEEIRLKAKGQLSEEVKTELHRMQEEIQSLRNTSTKFDMSFDAALERLEQRMDRVEERQGVTAAVTETAAAQQQQVVGR